MPKMRAFDDNVADFLRKPCYRRASKPRGTFLELFWGISRKIAGFGVSKRQKECLHDLPSPAQTFEYADRWLVNGNLSSFITSSLLTTCRVIQARKWKGIGTCKPNPAPHLASFTFSPPLARSRVRSMRISEPLACTVAVNVTIATCGKHFTNPPPTIAV